MTTNIQSNRSDSGKYGPVEITFTENAGSLFVRIETARLNIFSVNSLEHLNDFIELYGSQTINKYVGSGETQEADKITEKVLRWNKRWSDKNPCSGYVILEKGTNAFVGQAILKPLKDKAAGEGKFVEGIMEIGAIFKKSL